MEIQACRVCLSTEQPLNSFEENDVKTAFEDIIDCAVELNNGLPKHVCDPCKSSILEYAEFKKWCRHVQDLLKAELTGCKITKEVIEKLKSTITQTFHFLPDTKPWIDSKKIFDNDSTVNNFKQEVKEEICVKEEFICKPILPIIKNQQCDIKIETPDNDHKGQNDNEKNDNDHGNNDNDSDSDVQIIEDTLDTETPKECMKNVIKSINNNKTGKIPLKLATPNSKFEQIVGNTIIKRVPTKVQRNVLKKKQNVNTKVLLSKISLKNCYTWKPQPDIKEKVRKPMCDNCKYVFLNVQALQRHKLNGCANSVTCNPCRACGEAFPDPAQLEVHMAAEHKATTTTKYACAKCYRSFMNKSALEQHWKEDHELKEKRTPSKDIIIRQDTAQVQEGYICEQCGQQLKSTSDLRYHMTTHTGEKPFQCDICQKKFRVKYSLKLHINIHTGNKPYKCSFCPTSFYHVSHRIRHMRTHTGEQPFQCCVCGKRFASKYNMNTHIRTVHEGVRV